MGAATRPATGGAAHGNSDNVTSQGGGNATGNGGSEGAALGAATLRPAMGGGNAASHGGAALGVTSLGSYQPWEAAVGASLGASSEEQHRDELRGQ